MKKPEYKSHNLNNYSEQGTDTIGTCTKTYKFTVPEKVADSQLVLVMSNHGANSKGEEYNRRLHLIYFNDEIISTFTPGGKSCEPTVSTAKARRTTVNGLLLPTGVRATQSLCATSNSVLLKQANTKS